MLVMPMQKRAQFIKLWRDNFHALVHAQYLTFLDTLLNTLLGHYPQHYQSLDSYLSMHVGSADSSTLKEPLGGFVVPTSGMQLFLRPLQGSAHWALAGCSTPVLMANHNG